MNFANQSIVEKSRSFNKNGDRDGGHHHGRPIRSRTGREERITLLASNKDTTKLKLGFLLVKNPPPIDTLRKKVHKSSKRCGKLLTKSDADLALMGEGRGSASKMRMFLTRGAMAFNQLVTSALNGTYDDVDMTFFNL